MSLIGLISTPMDIALFAFTVTGLVLFRDSLRFSPFIIMSAAHETVVNNMPDPVFVLDEKNCIISLNPAAGQIIQLPLENTNSSSESKQSLHQYELLNCLNARVDENGEVVINEGKNIGARSSFLTQEIWGRISFKQIEA